MADKIAEAVITISESGGILQPHLRKLIEALNKIVVNRDRVHLYQWKEKKLHKKAVKESDVWLQKIL